jgi:hypothetical protein
MCSTVVGAIESGANRPDASDSRQADKRTEQATEQSRRASHETTRNDPPSSLFVCRFGNDTDEFGCGFAESFQDIDRAKLAERLPTPVVRQLPMFLAVLRRAGFFVFSQVAQVLEEFPFTRSYSAPLRSTSTASFNAATSFASRVATELTVFPFRCFPISQTEFKHIVHRTFQPDQSEWKAWRPCRGVPATQFADGFSVGVRDILGD